MAILNGSWSRRRLLTTGRRFHGGPCCSDVLHPPAAWAQDKDQVYCNAPTGDTVTFGFNVPQSGPYADEGKDELKALQLAVKHLNGEGDGGFVKTLKPSALKGNGVLGKKVAFVTGDTQTKTDAARASAKRMIESDKVLMICGGSSSGVAVAVQSLCQDAGVIFMAGLDPSPTTPPARTSGATASATSSTPTCRARRSAPCSRRNTARTARPIT